LRLLGSHRIHQNRLHVAAGGQLVELLHRQHRPLPAALAGLDNLDRHVLVAVGQLPQLLRKHIQGDRALVLGVLVHDELGELLLAKATRPCPAAG
jgi:hypothetical protein